MLKSLTLALATLLPATASAAVLDLSHRGLAIGAGFASATVDAAGDLDYFFAANASGPFQVIVDFLDLSAPFVGQNSILSLSTDMGDALEATLSDFASDAVSTELLFTVSSRSGAFADVSDLIVARFASSFAIGSFGEDRGVDLSFFETGTPVAPVPVPAAGLLLGSVLLGGMALRRRA